MKNFTLAALLSACLNLTAQVAKEEDLVYTNNYFTTEQFKALSEKPAGIKYEAVAGSASFTHTGKGSDTYNISELFPRGDYEHSVRDFNLSFNFSFTETSSPDDFFQLTFLVIPHQDIEYKDSVALVMMRIKANGTLYAEYGNMAYNNGICYSCPALAKDKTWGKVMGAEAPASFMKAIPGFKQNGNNKFSLTRTDDHWVLSINDNVLRDWKNMELGYINSRQAPMITLNGKCTIKIDNLQETYGHQNKSIVEYLEDFKGSGPATLRGPCIQGAIKAYYALTTNYGTPSVRISWRDTDLINRDQVVYFDFKEGANYGEYKYRGSSTKNMALFNEPGYAQDIRMKPDMGEISFDFYFQNFGSFEKTETQIKMTSKYCTVFISR